MAVQVRERGGVAGGIPVGAQLDQAPTGTGPGLEHLPTPVGEEVALVGAP